MKRFIVAGALTALLAFPSLGCNKDKTTDNPPAAASATGVASAASAAPTASAATADEADLQVPTQSDFEEEAEQQITPDNMDQQLTAIEKQLATAK